MNRSHDRDAERGFTLLELCIVVAISLVVAAVAIPAAVTAKQDLQLRSTAAGFSGVVQKARMYSVSRNQSFPVVKTTSSGTTTVSITLDTADTGNSSLQLPRGTTIDVSGTNPSDTALKGALNSYTTDLPRFNARGLPCYGSTPCTVNAGQMYITYLHQDRAIGSGGWAAITVTPAGRVQVWTWDGGNWK